MDEKNKKRALDEFTQLMGATEPYGDTAERMIVDIVYMRTLSEGELATPEEIADAGVCIDADGRFTTTRPPLPRN